MSQISLEKGRMVWITMIGSLIRCDKLANILVSKCLMVALSIWVEWAIYSLISLLRVRCY